MPPDSMQEAIFYLTNRYVMYQGGNKMSLATKYRPKKWEDVSEQTIVINMIRSLCESEELSCKNFLLIGPAGTGKAQPLYSKVLTPSGFIRMEDIEVGTEVFTGSGDVAKVIGVYPQGVRPIYEITLQDRTKIRVSDEHLNVVYCYNEDKKKREEFCVTTKDLITLFESSRFKLRIDTPSVDWGKHELPIDPYLLGALIGDGSLSNNLNFSNPEEDVVDKVDSILRRDWNMMLKKCPGNNVDYDIVYINEYNYKYKFEYKGQTYITVEKMREKLAQDGYPEFDGDTILRICRGEAVNVFKKYPELRDSIQLDMNENYPLDEGVTLKKVLDELGLLVKSVDKHIPSIYLMSDRDSRISLLQGLYDTDGYTDLSGVTIFSTSSSQLSEDFSFLVRSLGIHDTVVSKVGRYKSADPTVYIGCNESFDHNMKIPSSIQYYSSYKHSIRYKKRQNEPMRNIVSIEYVGDEECQCILVGHPDHTYISDGFIPTHNTTTARIMADVLNDGIGQPIELDAASHGSIDQVRSLVDQARQYPVGQKYKVIIADECFHENTNIRTPEGLKRIADIRKGDSVYNMTGSVTVSNVFKNTISVDNLVLMHLSSGQDILTTKNHLFFTDDGWVEAKNLTNEDYLYDYKTMCNLRKEFSNSTVESEKDLFQGVFRGTSKAKIGRVQKNLSTNRIQKNVSDMWDELLYSKKHKCNNVFKQVFSYLQEASVRFSTEQKLVIFAQAGIYLSNLWEDYENKKERSEEILFERMCKSSKEELSFSTSEDLSYKILRDMWQFLHPEISWDSNMLPILYRETFGDEAEREKESRIINSHEGEQSDAYAGCERKNDENERAKRYFAYSSCDTWGKWDLYTAADSIERSFRGQVGVRISCEDSCRFEKQHESLSYIIQTRPSLSRFTSRDRGGWCRPQYEISSVIRCQESKLPRKFRVESIKGYQPGNNDKSFERYFKSEQLHSGFVTLYDLEVSGHPSYFVEDVLVHNCHSFSNAAWQTLLKTLEDGSGRTVWIFCTTNPEKIPDTILSRVQTFQLSKISLEGIQKRLKYVVDKENEEGASIQYTEDGLNYIAKLANGGMRDSLTLLDKALAYDKNISSETLSKALNLPDYGDFFMLLNAYAKRSNSDIAAILDRVYNSGVNFVNWMESFHSFVMQVVKFILLKDINLTMIPSTYSSKIEKYSTSHLVVCLVLANTLVKLNQELKTTQYLQEMALTYLCSVPKKGDK